MIASAVRRRSLSRILARPLLPGLLLAAALAASAPEARAQQPRRAVTLTDLMQVRQVEDRSISADGRWIAFTAAPDRGDPEAVVRRVDGPGRFAVTPASDPVFSADAAWVAARVVPSLEERETTDDRGDLRDGLALVALPDGTVERIEGVRRFAFSPDGRWLAMHRYADPEGVEGGAAETGEPAGAGEPGPEGGAVEGDGAEGEDGTGTELVLRDLRSGAETTLPWVTAFAFSEDGSHLAYAAASADDALDGVRVRTLADGTESAADARSDGVYGGLTWGGHAPELAFLAADPPEGSAGPARAEVRVWRNGDADAWVEPDDAPEGWIIPTDGGLAWSEDGGRLFFGWRPLRDDERPGEGDADGGDEAAASAPFDPYDTGAILADRGVDVWHWRDPRIIPQQKVLWDREKDRTYRAVRHRGGGVVALGGPDLPDVRVPERGSVALATSDLPYRWESTWTGGAEDGWVVELDTGARTRFAEGLRSGPTLSPEGRFAVFWQEGHYHLYDVASGDTRSLTADLGVPVADEDWDYPEPAPGYGVAGWTEGDTHVLINDKYDVWVIPTDGGSAWTLTAGRGRAEGRIFRLAEGDDPLDPTADLLLTSYHDLRKNFGFYRARADRPGVERLLEEDKRFILHARADSVDRLLYSREAYDEFPDLWVADDDFGEPRKVTDVNPGLMETFAWGTAELLEWTSLDGTPLQGVVIKPGNYVEGRRYPVLVYYYRFFSQRLHEFNDPSVNHRPSFPVYASDDYVVFLPDVRFEVGRPGLASTKSVVPGVQKLIDVGLADPDAIALHGHSWSGYQTAFMVTQTDIFKTAVAGAPVANMTSAYSGIRLGSGLARQFQYEMSQSRIGASMWEALDEYVENSPVFYADRIETPMLILHGDVDDAVPWEQSIEMYLALRRLGKETVFLQYRDEPHHPQRYANKLDWSIKMKEWIDHYLKGTPAPAWIREGVPYRGR